MNTLKLVQEVESRHHDNSHSNYRQKKQVNIRYPQVKVKRRNRRAYLCQEYMWPILAHRRLWHSTLHCMNPGKKKNKTGIIRLRIFCSIDYLMMILSLVVLMSLQLQYRKITNQLAFKDKESPK
jgi:hypothetical protein